MPSSQLHLAAPTRVRDLDGHIFGPAGAAVEAPGRQLAAAVVGREGQAVAAALGLAVRATAVQRRLDLVVRGRGWRGGHAEQSASEDVGEGQSR